MKSASLLIAGILLGALLMYLYSGIGDAGGGETAGKEAESKVKLEAQIGALNARIAKLESERKEAARTDSGGDRVVAANPVRNKPRSRTVEKAVNIGGNDSFRKAMKKQQENLKKNRISSELGRMRGPLALTKEQEEAIGELIGRMKHSNGFITFEGADDEDTLSKTELDAGIRELLDDDQLAAFEQLRAADRINSIEAKANSELAGLQRTLNLTEDQKDAAFGVLTEFATNEVDAPKGVMDGNEGWMERRNQKIEALSEVLTPEQVEIYKSTPQVIATTLVDGWSTGTISLGSSMSGLELDVTPNEGNAGAEIEAESIRIGGLIREESPSQE